MFGDESYRDIFQPNLLGQETEQTFEAKFLPLTKMIKHMKLEKNI